MMVPLEQLETMVDALVKRRLAEMLGVNSPKVTQRQWYRASDAAKKLDLDTADNLHDLRLAGDLTEGKHWRDTSSKHSKRPTYQYHVGNCKTYLESRRS
ncbi:MAG: hypothetical protein O2890_09280 [Cyanobacteria bacterium]|nr:hypothetical protein [Cyanobacteriota bacterium]MDA0866598.1 hypothetical protein [Cyanobacteriota bacterium]